MCTDYLRCGLLDEAGLRSFLLAPPGSLLVLALAQRKVLTLRKFAMRKFIL